RFSDGLTGDEGTFSMCSFWYVECLSRMGDLPKARLFFEKMLGYANHLGLYGEELGPQAQHLGNFPQAFTHLALISAAFHLAPRPRAPGLLPGRRAPGPRPPGWPPRAPPRRAPAVPNHAPDSTPSAKSRRAWLWARWAISCPSIIMSASGHSMISIAAITARPA